MVLQKITYADKATGDQFTGAEATQLKAVVNAMVGLLDARYKSFFNVLDFGAKANDATFDNTTAFLNAIRACEAAGGGTVYVPRGVYYCNTFNQSANAVLWLQQADDSQPMNTVLLEGDFPVPGIPYDVAAPQNASIIASNATGVNTFSALLSAGSPASKSQSGFSLPNYVSLMTKNIIFRTKDNPTLGGVFARHAAGFEAVNCMADTGVGQFQLSEPTHDTVGFYMPQVNNYGMSRLTNCWVGGYGVGVNFSEHFMSDDTKIARCKVALDCIDSLHASSGTFNMFHCGTAVRFQGKARVDFFISLERSNDNMWWDYRRYNSQEIKNPSGLASGIIRYEIGQAGVGAIDDPITIDNGSKFLLIPLANAAGALGGSGGGPQTDTVVEDFDSRLTYVTVDTQPIDNGQGGTMRPVDTDLNASVTFNGAFTADHITIYTTTVSDCYDKVDVFIGGTKVGDFNPNTPERHDGVAFTFTFPLNTYQNFEIRPAPDATLPGGYGHFYYDNVHLYKA